MSDILVIKVKDGVNVSAKTMEHWKNEIRRMKESGIVVLPWYLHAEVVPEDIEIKIEEDQE